MVMKLLLTRGLGFEDVVILENSANFEEVIDSLQSVPDAVFLDIHMEPCDGFTMLQMLRERPQFEACPIIALTASVMNEEIEMLKSAGFDGGIAKPINQKLFPQLLANILRGDEVWSIS
jgi:two-component system cell cycle response regulator DivK